MHAEARSYIASHAPDCDGPVLEIGSRNINGGVRDLFPEAGYHGIDLAEGKGVDEVVDVIDFTSRTKFATVVCCEVLEHYEDPQALIDAAASHLKKGGTLLITAAGPSRKPHSGIDGGEVRDHEHYANIDPADLADWLVDFSEVTVDEAGDDVRAVAVK